PAIAERPGNSGLRAQAFGDDRLVTLDAGSLAPAASSPEERVKAFTDFLLEQRGYFGAGGARAEEIAFAPAVEEQRATRRRADQAEPYAFVALQQLHRGARVIDETQYGVFLLDREGRAGELRRVRAHLRNPSELPAPPAADPGVRRAADDAFRRYLTGRTLGGGDVSVEETPVISVRLRTAGYLARYYKRHADGTASRLAAVVEPATGQVKVLYDIPACRASVEKGGAR
ncbi:MAG TPA: hypothetical protein VFX96_07295, partial [Pyrinomonadaceae bacterium]|nr:hypothetical protein [Pyrinomonadaceae bacterium]